MTDKTGSSVMDTSRGTSVMMLKDMFKMPKQVQKALRQAVNNRPYEVFKFKTNTQQLIGQTTGHHKVKDKLFQFPMPEVQSILNDIGFDIESDESQYFWFLKRILLQELPKGWSKEISMMGEAYYHNSQLNITTQKHPFIKHYRKMFNQILISRKKIQQQTSTGIIIEGPPKRLIRRATFINCPQEELDLESSKEIDESQRLEEEVYGETDILDFKNVMNRLTQQSEIQFKRIEDINSLASALSFYERIIGLNLTKAPSFIKNLPDYLKVTPDELIQLGIKYKLDLRSELDLLWVVRMVRCLPLPPFWQKVVNDKQREEFDEEGNWQYPAVYYKDLVRGSKFNFHPCSLFIIKLIQNVRLDKANRGTGRAFIQPRNQRRKLQQRIQQSQNQAAMAFKFMDDLNRVYRCTGKDLFDMAYDQLNLENRTLEDVFAVDSESIVKEFEFLQNVFEQQVGTYIHEKQLTDAEIRAVFDQCKLVRNRETYLYKIVYEFLTQKYEEQEQLCKLYESNKNKDQTIDLPKIWIFRQTVEGQIYWIEKNTKEITKIYPFLADARKMIEEVKVTNSAIEKYVSSTSQVNHVKKIFKVVENYEKLKSFSTVYISKLIQINLPEEARDIDYEVLNDEIVERAEADFKPKDFLEKIMQDLNIEEDMSKQELMQWMFGWPYELSDEYFNQKEEIQKKIEEDLKLIRAKSKARKETLERMIKKITVINRLGKFFGGPGKAKPPASERKMLFTEQMTIRLQEEELLQKIKKTKALVGISDIRIKKKLRILLSKAMLDDNQKDKLAELEKLEKELLDSKKKSIKNKLRQKLKIQLGLNDSGLDDEEDDEDDDGILSNEDRDNGLDIVEDNSQSDNGGRDSNVDQDEPADDSFTFKGAAGAQKKKEEDEDEQNYHYVNENDDQKDHNDNSAQKLMEAYQQQQKMLMMQETLEQRRKRLENMVIQNRVKELIESDSFVKRIRRKLRHMNITKTQEDLKKKIIFLKMMQLRAMEDVEEGKQSDGIDFLQEALNFQEDQTSEDQSFMDESSVSLIEKIEEADQYQEYDHDPLEDGLGLEGLRLSVRLSLRKSLYKSPIRDKRGSMDNVDDFYDEFNDLKSLQNDFMSSRKATMQIRTPTSRISSIRNSQGEIEAQQTDGKKVNAQELALNLQLESVLKRTSTLAYKSRKSNLNLEVQKNWQSMGKSSRNSQSTERGISPQRLSGNSLEFKMDFNSSSKSPLRREEIIEEDDEHEHHQENDDQMIEIPLLLSVNNQQSLRHSLKSNLEQIDLNIGQSKSDIVAPRVSIKDFQINNNLTTRRTILQRVEENRNDSDGGSISSRDKHASPRKGTVDLSEKASQLQKKRESYSQLQMFREMTKANQDLAAHSNALQIVENTLETLPEDVEFQRFLAKIRIFDDEKIDDFEPSQLDEYGKFILDFYYKTTGQPQESKEKLKLSQKYNQSLNINSILFTAQKLRIKVLAQRETDLLWIAQEYLAHSAPPLAEYKGEKTNGGLSGTENLVERIKNFYFRLLVKEQRKIRVERIKNEVKDSEELDQYMIRESWVVICDKQNYYRYNYQTKEQRPINESSQQAELQRKLQLENEGSIVKGEVVNNLVGFLLKKGLLVVSKEKNPQAPKIHVSLPIQQAQISSPMSKIGQNWQTTTNLEAIAEEQKLFSRQDLRKQSDSLSDMHGQNHQQQQKKMQQINEYFLEDDRSDSKSSMMHRPPTTAQGINEINRTQSSQSYRNSPSAYNTSEQRNIWSQQSSKMAQQNGSQTSRLMMKGKYAFENTYGPKLTPFSLKLESQTSRFESHLKSKDRRSSQITDFQADMFPIRNIKRVILNNNQESLTKIQLLKLEKKLASMSNKTKQVEAKEPNVCLKFLEKQMNTQGKTPIQDLAETLISSSNFNRLIFNRMQEKVTLKSVSYLTQQYFQQNIDTEHDKLAYQKDVYLQKMELAQNLASTLPYNYHQLLRDNEEETKKFKEIGAQKGILYDQIADTRDFFKKRNMTKSQSQILRTKDITSHTGREKASRGQNDFRNLSPKSLHRFAQNTDLSQGFAKRMGLLKNCVGSQQYGKLGRLQEDKIVFAQVETK